MRGVRHSFLAVVLLLVCGMASASARVVTATARHTSSVAVPNSSANPLQPLEESHLPPNPRNGLFVGNNPINGWDPYGLQEGPVSIAPVNTPQGAASLGRALQFLDGAIDGTARVTAGAAVATALTGDSEEAKPVAVSEALDKKQQPRPILIGDNMARVCPAGLANNAETWDPTKGPIFGWLTGAMAQGRSILDIGFDSDRSEPGPVYLQEIQFLNNSGYPRSPTPWPGSAGSPPGGHPK